MPSPITGAYHWRLSLAPITRAYHWRVLVPQNAVHDRSTTSHAVNLFDMAAHYADLMSTEEALAALAGLLQISAIHTPRD